MYLYEMDKAYTATTNNHLWQIWRIFVQWSIYVYWFIGMATIEWTHNKIVWIKYMKRRQQQTRTRINCIVESNAREIHVDAKIVRMVLSQQLCDVFTCTKCTAKTEFMLLGCFGSSTWFAHDTEICISIEKAPHSPKSYVSIATGHFADRFRAMGFCLVACIVLYHIFIPLFCF